MPRKIRQIRVEGNIAYVPLTRGYEAVIDAIDAVTVCHWNWHAHLELSPNGAIRTVYAKRGIGGGKVKVSMHASIMDCRGRALEVDHRDGNGLNNRRANLRLASHSENTKNARLRVDNASGIKGVHWDSKSLKWRAQIAVNGRRIYLGLFAHLGDARDAYANASEQLHGDFGRVK